MLDKITASFEEDDEEGIRAEVILGREHVARATYGDDPFMESAAVFKSYDGVHANTKRRITNKLRKAYTGKDGAKSKKEEYASDATGYDAFEVIQPPWNLDYLAELYEVSAPHYAAVKAKVANIVGLGFNLVESPKMKHKIEDVSDDQEALDKLRRKMARAKDNILQRLDEMNSDDTFIEVLVKVWTDYEVTGNGYIEVGRTISGEIGYIGHIPTTSMRLRRRRDGFVQVIADKVVFFRNFGEDTADPIGEDSSPNEVIHLKKYAPSSGYYGVPDIVAAAMSVAGNKFAGKYNLDYFENKAVPRHYVIAKGVELSVTAKSHILEFFETGLQGKNHRTLYVSIPADTQDKKTDFSINPVEAGVQESSFEKYRASNNAEILMVHRVPITKVSTPQGVSLANARDADKTFSEQVCQPEQNVAEKKVGKIIAELTDAFVLKFNQMSLTDAMTQASIDQLYVRNDVMEPNEVRAAKGLPGIPGGDQTVGMYAQAELTANTSIKQTKMSNDAAKEQAQAAASAGAGPSQNRANQRATANQSRTRDTARSTNAPDKQGEGRQPKGDGRVAQ